MYLLPELPYPKNALEPFITAEIMELHHQKHHKGYVEKLNEIIATYDPTLFDCMSETTMAMYINTFPISIRQNVKNQLGGHVNHSFFWSLLSTKNTDVFKQKLEPIFKDQFGSFDQAMDEFKTEAKNHFGSGWTWFCYNPISENIEIRSYQNQDNPLFDNLYPLLGIDVWEHAYYLQYKNKRSDYIEAFTKIINWEYVFELWNSYNENKQDDGHESVLKEDGHSHHGHGCC